MTEWKKWTSEEDQLLLSNYELLQKEELSWEQISDKLDRSIKSCQSRIDRIKFNRLATEQPVKRDDDTPSKEDLFTFLRDSPRSLEEICNRYDKSPATIKEILDEMKEEGYVLQQLKDRTYIETINRPETPISMPSIASIEGDTIAIGIASDLHHGGNKAQITSYNRFVKYCVEKGVRHIMNPGDRFTGVAGYRGHELDMVTPLAYISSRGLLHKAVDAQIDLSLMYTPKYDGVKYYELGGNHDYWCVTTTGIDAVRKFCDKREDAIYLGYDVASIPLTDQVDVKLWHPSGGVPYAKSYRLQKGIESQAIDEMQQAIRDERSPKVNVLIAGHLHISSILPDLPIPGIHPGCFEGRTNYLKRKGLYPSIGGTILTFRIGDDGKIKSTTYEFVPFEEIKDDWKQYPVPDVMDIDTEPDLSWMEAIYETNRDFV